MALATRRRAPRARRGRSWWRRADRQLGAQAARLWSGSPL